MKRPVQFLFAVLLLTSLVLTSADAREDRERQLQTLQARIQALMSEMEDTRGRRDHVKTQLARLERDLGRVHKELRDTRERFDKANDKLKVLQLQVSREQTGLRRERLALEGSLRAAYAEGRQPMVKLLLNQRDPERIGRLVGYHAYIQRDRIRRVKHIRERLDRVLTLENDIRLQAARLQELTKDQHRQMARIRTQTQARQRVLVTLEKALSQQSDHIAGLHSVQWDATALASGTYFYRIESAGKAVQTKKAILIK